jgi:hypothetical protein
MGALVGMTVGGDAVVLRGSSGTASAIGGGRAIGGAGGGRAIGGRRCTVVGSQGRSLRRE